MQKCRKAVLKIAKIIKKLQFSNKNGAKTCKILKKSRWLGKNERTSQAFRRVLRFLRKCDGSGKKAGYSEKTAGSQGQRLLKKVEIANYIADLQEQAQSERIADVEQV